MTSSPGLSNIGDKASLLGEYEALCESMYEGVGSYTDVIIWGLRGTSTGGSTAEKLMQNVSGEKVNKLRQLSVPLW